MRIRSLLIGAAVATVVIIPAFAGDAGWINGQWRICFAWKGKDATGVEIVDYH